jgi:general secretion pathway protein L
VRRPDFLDGLGVYVGATDVAIAGVSKRLLQVRLREARAVPLPPRDQADARRLALAGAVRDFVTTHEIDPSHAVLCVPRSDAAVTRVLLPAAAQENLEQVLEYEMENLVPLPREEIFFDYTVRPLGAERIEVLLVCVPRDVINGYLAALDDAGVKPRSIGLPSTALADYVTFCRGDVAPGMGVVVQATDATEIALFSQGRLVASQLVPAPNASEPAVLQRSLQRQLADELFEPEQTMLYRWSLMNGHAPAVTELGDANLVEMAKGKLATGDAEFAPATPAILPAVGAALGAVREGVVRLNLLPAEQREAFDEGPSIATWVLLALSALLLVVWGASAMMKDGSLRRDVQTHLTLIQPEVDEVIGLQEEIDHLQRQVEILGQQDGRVTTLLKELTELIPSDAYLTTLNLRGGRLTLDGQARSASDIITALEKSKRFKNVNFSSPTTRQGDKERFALTAEVVK